jgi:hypothetical protein
LSSLYRKQTKFSSTELINTTDQLIEFLKIGLEDAKQNRIKINSTIKNKTKQKIVNNTTLILYTRQTHQSKKSIATEIAGFKIFLDFSIYKTSSNMELIARMSRDGVGKTFNLNNFQLVTNKTTLKIGSEPTYQNVEIIKKNYNKKMKGKKSSISETILITSSQNNNNLIEMININTNEISIVPDEKIELQNNNSPEIQSNLSEITDLTFTPLKLPMTSIPKEIIEIDNDNDTLSQSSTFSNLIDELTSFIKFPNSWWNGATIDLWFNYIRTKSYCEIISISCYCFDNFKFTNI